MLHQVEPVEFKDIPDGSYFMRAITWAYGSSTVYQKTLEDGGEHNAVRADNTNQGIRLGDRTLVVLVQG